MNATRSCLNHENGAGLVERRQRAACNASGKDAPIREPRSMLLAGWQKMVYYLPLMILRAESLPRGARAATHAPVTPGADDDASLVVNKSHTEHFPLRSSSSILRERERERGREGRQGEGRSSGVHCRKETLWTVREDGDTLRMFRPVFAASIAAGAAVVGALFIPPDKDTFKRRVEDTFLPTTQPGTIPLSIMSHLT